MPIARPTKTPAYHPNRRREVLAVADVSLRQVQLIDTNGQIRSIVLWQCGTDVLYAESIAALSDPQRLKQAPTWVKDQLASLGLDRQFLSDGTPYTEKKTVTAAPVSTSVRDTKVEVPAAPGADADDDLPEFRSA